MVCVMRRFGFGTVGLLAACVVACGGDGATDPKGSGASTSGATGSGGSGATGTGSSGETTSSGAGASGGAGVGGSGASSTGAGGMQDLSMGCAADPPAGATLAAPPKPYTGGTCPVFPQVTTQDVVIQSSGGARSFWLVVPSNLDPNEKLPVIFLWHWLNASPGSFFDKGEVQAAVDEQRFLAIIPAEKGDLTFTWPYSAIDSAARLEEEGVFFDDMLSCVSEQFNVNSNCVASTGVSAGALFTDQLVGIRGDWIASFMSLSGGTGGVAVKPWTAPAHKMPGFVLWGGPTDSCFGILNFEQASKDLEDHLTSDGHFFLECIHNCGHAVPPFEPPPGSSKFKALWQFALDHPFWAKPGQSPYLSGLPADLPPWCGIGQGSAVPASGPCPDPPGC